MSENSNITNLVEQQNITTEASPSVHAVPFSMISNQLIQASGLTSRARMLLIYLISFGKGWVFYDEVIRRDLIDIGKNKLKDLFKELREAGYIKTVPIMDERGIMRGSKRIFSASPEFRASNREPNFPTVGSPSARKSAANNNNSNKNNNNKKNNNNPVVAVLDVQQNKDSLVEELKTVGLDDFRIQQMMVNYEHAYIREKLELLKAKKRVSSPKGFLIKALQDDWKADKPQATPPKSNVQPIREKMSVNERQSLWVGSSESQRASMFERAQKGVLILSEMVKNVDYLADSFMKHPAFSLAMDYLESCRYFEKIHKPIAGYGLNMSGFTPN